MNWIALIAALGIVGLFAGWFVILIYLTIIHPAYGLGWSAGSFIVLCIGGLYFSMKE